MKRLQGIMIAAVLGVTTAGCSHIRSHTIPPEQNLMSGAGSLFAKDGAATGFEQIDIDKLLLQYKLNDADLVSTAASTGDQTKYKYLRNDLQDRIIAASNQRCGYYLRELVSAKSQTQMGWGTLGLLLSGAASVTTPASAARALAAGSTAATGINSLYNEAYFNNLTVNVIASGINKQREGYLIQMTEFRKRPLADYPVTRAIADAIAYHASCNMVTGLEAAANALKLAPAAATKEGPGTGTRLEVTTGTGSSATTSNAPQRAGDGGNGNNGGAAVDQPAPSRTTLEKSGVAPALQ